MITRLADGIPVGLSIVLYLVSNVRNTLVILTILLLISEGILYIELLNHNNHGENPSDLH